MSFLSYICLLQPGWYEAFIVVERVHIKLSLCLHRCKQIKFILVSPWWTHRKSSWSSINTFRVSCMFMMCLTDCSWAAPVMCPCSCLEVSQLAQDLYVEKEGCDPGHQHLFVQNIFFILIPVLYSPRAPYAE